MSPATTGRDTTTSRVNNAINFFMGMPPKKFKHRQYTTLVTPITTDKELFDILGRVETNPCEFSAEDFRDRKEPLARLIYGILIREKQPELAKDVFSGVASELSGEYEQKARVHLATCYSLTGECSEGLAIVNDVLSEDLTDFVHFQALLAKATLKITAPKKSLEILAEAERYVDSVNLGLRGKFHNQRARALKELGEYDRASEEYAGAAKYFEDVNSLSCSAIAINNQASVFKEWKRFLDAHEAVDRAIRLFRQLRDPGLPHAQDQKAQIYVAEGRWLEAKQLIDRVISSVGQGDKKELVCECLVTRARALVGLGSHVDAFRDLNQAQSISEYLSRPDLSLYVEKARKSVAEEIALQAQIKTVTLALHLANGSFREAASRLGITHVGLLKFVAKHSIDRKPHRSTFGIPKTTK